MGTDPILSRVECGPYLFIFIYVIFSDGLGLGGGGRIQESHTRTRTWLSVMGENPYPVNSGITRQSRDGFGRVPTSTDFLAMSTQPWPKTYHTRNLTPKSIENSTLGLGTTNFRQRFKCTRCPRSVNVVDLKNKRKLKAPNLIIEGLEICNGGIKGGWEVSVELIFYAIEMVLA